MANAYIICSNENADSVITQMKNNRLDEKEIESKNNHRVFYTRAKFFESGGTIENATVILTSDNDYVRTLRNFIRI